MKHEIFKKDGLDFSCKQKVSDFKPNTKGYYCELCSKTIIDFRNKSKNEYLNIINESPDACGIFYKDQMGYDKEVKVNFKKSFLVLSFLSSFFVSRNSYSQQNPKPKIEITDSTSVNKDEHIEQNSTDNSNKEQKNKCSKKHQKRYRRHNKKRLYFNSSFPFIHYDNKRTTILGAPQRNWEKK